MHNLRAFKHTVRGVLYSAVSGTFVTLFYSFSYIRTIQGLYRFLKSGAPRRDGPTKVQMEHSRWVAIKTTIFRAVK